MSSEYSVITLPSKPKVISEDANRGVYEIGSIYPGYGQTIGTILRRIILSSIPGASITNVKINGVDHEFSNIKGVKEDIIYVLLNIKRLRFKIHTDEPQEVCIKKKGVGAITSADVIPNPEVEVIDDNHHIAEITDQNTELDIVMRVERGVGFVPRDEGSRQRSDIGSMTFDKIFSPIRRVNYEVEDMRVGERVDYNRLRILIETDGTVLPREVLELAVNIAITQLQALVGFQTKESTPQGDIKEEDIRKERGSIHDLELSPRVTQALIDGGVTMLEDLEIKSRKDLTAMKGVGEKAVDEIEEALAERGLSLKKLE